MLQAIIARLMKMLTRRGVLVEDVWQTWLAEPDADEELARTRPPLGCADTLLHRGGLRRHQRSQLRVRGQDSMEADQV